MATPMKAKLPDKCPNCGGPVVKDEHCVSCKDEKCGWGICS